MTSAKRKICVITGSRADYGLLYWLMKEIQEDPDLELQIVVTGMHLCPEFGLTFHAIEADELPIDAKVEMILSSDSRMGVVKSMGVGLIGFADALDRLKPDIAVVLGDRFEILTAVQSCLVLGIPVAHISGGELTLGAMDDSIRHAITKMSHVHFVATEEYRRRVIQMGELPARVINCGDPGLDNLHRLKLLTLDQFSQSIGFDVTPGFLLVTYHPATMSQDDPRTAMQSLLDALDQFPDLKLVITKPNADMVGRALGQMVDAYGAARSGRVFVTSSLGQLRYLSAMTHCLAVVGNSSSGIVEAPAAHRPTVNIGPRQDGRLKAESIIDCAEETQAIIHAIREALSPACQDLAKRVKSVYGDCNATTRMKAILKDLDISMCRVKPFHDLP